MQLLIIQPLEKIAYFLVNSSIKTQNLDRVSLSCHSFHIINVTSVHLIDDLRGNIVSNNGQRNELGMIAEFLFSMKNVR